MGVSRLERPLCAQSKNPPPKPPNRWPQIPRLVLYVLGGIGAIAVYVQTMYLIFWMVPLNPKLRIDSVSTSAFRVRGPLFSADWNIGFTLSGPGHGPDNNNNRTLSYGVVLCAVSYEGNFLGANFVKLPLVLGAADRTAVNVSVVEESGYIDVWTWEHMTADRSSRGSLTFTVWFEARGVDTVCFTCEDLVVNFGFNDSASGELLGGSRNCSISTHCHIRTWKAQPSLH